MGLFRRTIEPPENRDLTRQEAFAGILLAACACDGHITQEEVQGLFTTTERMRMFENVSPTRWNQFTAGLLRLLRNEGPLKLVERCAEAVPDNLRQTAFANACDLVLADGVVEAEERTFLDHLRKSLRLDGDTALNIVEVMIIKNKG